MDIVEVLALLFMLGSLELGRVSWLTDQDIVLTNWVITGILGPQSVGQPSDDA